MRIALADAWYVPVSSFHFSSIVREVADRSGAKAKIPAGLCPAIKCSYPNIGTAPPLVRRLPANLLSHIMRLQDDPACNRPISACSSLNMHRGAA